MPFSFTQIINPIGEVSTIKDASGNAALNVTLSEINILKKYLSDLNEIKKACNSAGWELFYNIDLLQPVYLYGIELMIKNLDFLRVDVNDKTIIEILLKDLKNFKSEIISCDKSVVNVKLDLNQYKGQSIKVYQKRRSGNGNLSTSGYILTYGELV